MYQFMNKPTEMQSLPQSLTDGTSFQKDKINQTGIPMQMKQHYERISGCCLDDVRVHYQSDKPVQLKALAYAQGNQIFMAPGQEKHLGHELAHVIQQKQGRVSPTEYHAGIPINTDRQLEQEADNMHNQYLYSPLQRHTAAKEVTQLLKQEDVDPNHTIRTMNLLSKDFRLVLRECKYGKLLDTRKNLTCLEDAFTQDVDSLYTYCSKGRLLEGENREEYFLEYTNNVLGRIRAGVRFLCASIDYWIGEIRQGHVDFLQSDKEPEVIEICLTGSDLHDEGLGAVFVTFRLVESYLWFFSSTVDKTVVIKPENRDIEESLLSDQETSLASQYNQSEWEIEEQSDEGVVGLNEEEGKISTIKMKASREYGTIIEKIVGKRITNREKDSPINLVSTVKSIVFAAMCGLYDLHHENVLWDKDGELYFIDADNALKSNILNSTQRAQKQAGFPVGFQTGQTLIELRSISPDMIEATKQAFEGKHGRIVPLFTQYLQRIKSVLWIFPVNNRLFFLNYQYADKLLYGEADEQGIPIQGMHRMKEGIEKVLTEEESDIMREIMEFQTIVGPGLVIEAGAYPDTFNRQLEVRLAYDDFMSGQIPFFEYWYTEGEIKHKGHTICGTRNLDEVFEEVFEGR